MKQVKISDLKIGMLVDCKYDPANEFEYSVVMELELETPNCQCVYFDFGAVGYHPNDLVGVAA